MALIESPNAFQLTGKPLFVESICLEGTLAMVGDTEVLQTKLLSSFGHLFQ